MVRRLDPGLPSYAFSMAVILAEKLAAYNKARMSDIVALSYAANYV